MLDFCELVSCVYSPFCVKLFDFMIVSYSPDDIMSANGFLSDDYEVISLTSTIALVSGRFLL